MKNKKTKYYVLMGIELHFPIFHTFNFIQDFDKITKHNLNDFICLCETIAIEKTGHEHCKLLSWCVIE